MKSVAMQFTRSRHVEELPTLTLKGDILPYEKEVKLTWSSQASHTWCCGAGDAGVCAYIVGTPM